MNNSFVIVLPIKFWLFLSFVIKKLFQQKKMRENQLACTKSKVRRQRNVKNSRKESNIKPKIFCKQAMVIVKNNVNSCS